MAKTISLIAKLAEACDAVGGVEKRGRNDFQRYDYVKAADVAKAIRHELFRRGILTIIDEKEWTQDRMIKTNSGGEVPLMRLKCEVTFRDEHEVLGPFGAFATAFDSGDKAIFKAKTGLLKYALRGIGLIPDERDDPEADESVDEQTDPRVLEPGEKKARKAQNKIKEFQARAWSAALRASGKTAEQEATYLRVRWSAKTIMDLNQEDFKEAIKFAAGTEELAKTLETSVAANTAELVAKSLGAIKSPIPDEYDQRVAGE